MVRRFRASVVAAGLAAGILACGFASADEGVPLRRAYKAGERYLAVMTSAQDSSQTEPNGAVTKIRQTQRTEMLLDVLAVGADGTAQVRATYQRMAMGVESANMKIDYDSADPVKKAAENPLLTITKVLVGKSIGATITDRGEVTAVAGTEPIIAEVMEKIPAGPNRAAAKQGVEKSLGPAGFKQQLAIFGIPMPAEPKVVGQSWNWDQNVSLGFADMLVHMVCKVEAVTDKTVELSVSSTTEVTKSAPGYTVTLDPAGRNTGKATLDRANTAVSAGTSQSNMTMTIVIQGQTVVSKTTGTSTVTVTKQ